MPAPLRPTRCWLLSLAAVLTAVAAVNAFYSPARLVTPRSCSCRGSRGDKAISAAPAQRCNSSSSRTTLDCSVNSSRHNTFPAWSWSPSMSFFTEEPISRGRAIGIGLSAWLTGLTWASGSGLALGPVRKTQELLRIWGQQEADNALGGRELASPEGGKTLQPVLALIPIVTLRLQLDEVESNLKEPRRFGDALAILQTQDFQKKDIKRVFNAYSDNIYYLPNSERENKYLQGGATPSTRQTLQYLLRNEVIDNVEALTAEIAYLIREREAAASASGDNGGSSVATADTSAPDLDEKDLRMYLAKCKNAFDRYLGMVLQNETDEATGYAKMALAAKNKRNVPSL